MVMAFILTIFFLSITFSEKQKRIAQTAALFDDDEEEDQEEEVRGRRSEEPSTSSSFSSVPLAPRKSTLQDVRDAMERALYDETKKTCMLCKRAFSDVEVLRKHVEKSDLHRVCLKVISLFLDRNLS